MSVLAQMSRKQQTDRFGVFLGERKKWEEIRMVSTSKLPNSPISSQNKTMNELLFLLLRSTWSIQGSGRSSNTEHYLVISWKYNIKRHEIWRTTHSKDKFQEREFKYINRKEEQLTVQNKSQLSSSQNNYDKVQRKKKKAKLKLWTENFQIKDITHQQKAMRFHTLSMHPIHQFTF